MKTPLKEPDEAFLDEQMELIRTKLSQFRFSKELAERVSLKLPGHRPLVKKLAGQIMNMDEEFLGSTANDDRCKLVAVGPKERQNAYGNLQTHIALEVLWQVKDEDWTIERERHLKQIYRAMDILVRPHQYQRSVYARMVRKCCSFVAWIKSKVI